MRCEEQDGACNGPNRSRIQAHGHMDIASGGVDAGGRMPSGTSVREGFETQSGARPERRRRSEHGGGKQDSERDPEQGKPSGPVAMSRAGWELRWAHGGNVIDRAAGDRRAEATSQEAKFRRHADVHSGTPSAERFRRNQGRSRANYHWLMPILWSISLRREGLYLLWQLAAPKAAC